MLGIFKIITYQKIFRGVIMVLGGFPMPWAIAMAFQAAV